MAFNSTVVDSSSLILISSISLSVGGEFFTQVNCVAAVLLLPAASVKVFAVTSIDVAPFPDGVKVAV